MEDWARNLFQSNGLSYRPEKRNAPINNAWNENGTKPCKKMCYESPLIHKNRTGDTQSSVSTGLPHGPSTVKTSVTRNIIPATESITYPFNIETSPRSPATLFRDNVLESATLTQDITSSFSLQEHDLCWFAQPASEGHQPCLFWTTWKRRIPRERRLHSLTSFLAVCGWVTGNGCAVRINRGIIVIDDCDGVCKTSVLDTLDELQRNSISSDERTAIWVFGCRSSEIPLRLYP